MTEVTLYRIDGYFVDIENMSWIDTGMRDHQGRRVFSDGATLATRAGQNLSARDIAATELTGGKA